MRSILCQQILLMVCVTAAQAAEDATSKTELVEELSKLLPPDTITNGQVVVLNGFRVEASHVKEVGQEFKPTGREFDSLFVVSPGTFTTSVAKDSPPARGGGVSIFHKDSGTPLMTFADSDGDGRPDLVEYSNVDASGKVTITVIDYEADGQADFRINFAERYNELWHLGRWHRMEMREERRGIVLDGVFIELQRRNNRFHVP